MKLPKGFGGGMGDMMRKAQEAMARAQTLEQELALERLELSTQGVKTVFDGTGNLLSLSIPKEVIDPDDKEALEDLIVSAIRAGFEQATEMRNAKVSEITKDVPALPGM